MDRKIGVVLCLMLGILFNIKAQETIIPDVNYNQLERYIELAKENFPRKKVFEAQEEGAKAGVPVASLAYLEAFNASYFYRPNDRSAMDVNNPFIVNGFQFGVNVNLGTLLQTPFRVKQAKEQYKVAVEESNEYTLMLTNEVKRRYYDYLLTLKDLRVKTTGVQNAISIGEELRYKFENGEINHESYSFAVRMLTEAESGNLLAESALLKAKDALEEIIGTTLENAKVE